MGHTNTTPNYNLPQFLGSDKPAWLTDVNNAMSAIDTAIAAAKAAADNAGGAAAALATTVGGHTTQLETLSGTVANQGVSIVSQGNAINTISELIGNGTPTTTDHTLIGAINELNAKEGNLADLQTTDKSSLVAAINEAAQSGGGVGGSVSVTADDTKTYKQLLEELYALADITKIDHKSVLFHNNDYMVLSKVSSGNYTFTGSTVSSSRMNSFSLTMSASSGTAYAQEGTTIQNYSSSAAPSGSTIVLYY